ncbi:uncharacterized protein EI90DRAFT_2933611 [Cantharellus anzutake]|uniref:uncharacterized protein n=1 Tax=Cantharellus anzutake TaxID=1750568 RepID=UPI0019034A9F|nr:uncharacterized protein EI90DRAFT_2933611 [Cantharellus anzutake]KAF8324928.1 hypothetical protein EI90DRAFT_2933611 [Cantharellus anzutake]
MRPSLATQPRVSLQLRSPFAIRILVFWSSLCALWALSRWRYETLPETDAGVRIYWYEDRNKPPLYPALLERERRMPQHSEAAPPPDGRSAKYLRFSNQLRGVGFNNQMQEILLNSYIAYLLGRSYVFSPYTWDLKNEPFVPVEHNTHLAGARHVRPSRVPLTAFLNGPTAGAPWIVDSSLSVEQLEKTPRAISARYWDEICPDDSRYNINTTEVNARIGVDFDNDDGAIIVDKWVAFLGGIDDQRCINIMQDTPRIIDFGILSSERLVSIWPGYSKSPVLTQFKWSPIVLGAVQKNLPLLLPPSRLARKISKIKNQYLEIPGLVTLHIRRGDFESHCVFVSTTFASFEGWNQLPFLPDGFNSPQSPQERGKYTMERCWIEIPDVVSRLESLRRQYSELTLDRVFLSTNAKPEWLAELKHVLSQHGWRNVVSTSDISLTWQESGVENAVDIEIASRGQIFVGNGFSSFSSTIIRLRMVRGLNPKYTRRW